MQQPISFTTKGVAVIWGLLIVILMSGCQSELRSPVAPDSQPLVNTIREGLKAVEGYRWQNHAAPFDFLFGNHIDTHQQSKTSGNGQLEGFFYIKFTGNINENGYPEAIHADCVQEADNCTVGWILNGLPVEATLVSKAEGQHPTWCIDPADLPAQPGYTHFHWFGQPEHAGGLNVGQTYDGMLLTLTARETFFFKHHGGFLITPGIDTVSHANIVTDCS